MLYYAGKISPNMARTPDGFLICQNVPIARTGKQMYMASELPLKLDDLNEQVPVYRDEEEVFAPSAMASFEGKPVTNEHPDEPVTPDNVQHYIKGIATNIRRGQGKESDKLLADLLIYEASLIAEIENGKREVSCGYECESVPTEDGRIVQRNIVGNHIAVVSAGRAGSRVAIKDENRKQERGTKMKRSNNSKTKFAFASTKLARFFNRDADPDEVSEALEDFVEAVVEVAEGETLPLKADETAVPVQSGNTDEESTQDNETVEALNKILGKLEWLETRITDMEAFASKDSDPLSKLEDELSEDNEALDEEAEVIEQAEAIDEDTIDEDTLDEDTRDNEAENENVTDSEEVTDEEGLIMPAEGRPVNPINKDAALKEVRRLKPIVAGIKDAKKRKQMSDSLAKMIRMTYGISGQQRKKSKDDSYTAILQAQRRSAASYRAADSIKSKREQEVSSLGKKIAKKRLGKY